MFEYAIDCIEKMKFKRSKTVNHRTPIAAKISHGPGGKIQQVAVKA